jgi:NRPS condensation-like uncharacterized protein
MLNIAHAASDGIGGLRLLRSIARAYAAHPDPLPPVDALGARSLGHLFAAPGSFDWLDRMRALHQAQMDAWLAPPARIVPDGGTERPGYGVHHVVLPAEMASRLRPKRFAPGTMNDLFLAAMHRTIEQWNRARGVEPARIALMVGVNLRPKSWWREIFGNFSLSSTVSTWPDDRSTPALLMRSIVAQTLRIKENPAAAVLADVYASASAMPIEWKRAMPSLLARLGGDRFMPTAVVSSLGRIDEPFSFGDGGPATEVWVSGSSRMPMGLMLAPLSYRGALHLSFRYRHPQMSEAAAHRFAEMYVDSLRFVG